MIISRTPFRISLFGGGTDYPTWVEENGGDVLGFAIDKYCWLTLRRLPPFFPYKHRIVYSNIELVDDVREIQHPAVRAILSRRYWTADGIELHHDGDLPARGGLGSSSSFAVGLINAMSAMSGRMCDRRYLAAEAIRIEQQVLKENVGSQDQVMAAYGGFNRIRFHASGDFTVVPVVASTRRRAELLAHLMLFYTGTSRLASEIAGRQIAGFRETAPMLRAIGDMVPLAVEVLHDQGEKLSAIGELLHTSWCLKRQLADGITTPQVDQAYAAARDAGAVGGKLLGAGGGGFVLFFVPPECQDAVREKLTGLVEVKFGIDRQGSQIVLYEPNGLSS